MHLHIHVGGCPKCDAVRETVALGDGKILKLILTWGPVIAQLFGLRLPPLPVEDEAKGEHPVA